MAGLVSNTQTILENKTVNAVPATHLDFDGINDYVNREIKGWKLRLKSNEVFTIEESENCFLTLKIKNKMAENLMSLKIIL